MIVVNSALMQEKIIVIVENIVIDGSTPFKLVNKKGIKIYFESSYTNLKEACSIIKNEIKQSYFGNALYFNVVEE